MLTLYYDSGKASLTPHMLLNEIGCPFDLVAVDCARGEQRTEAYLRLNPQGRIPTLVHDGIVIYETAAILLHLVERFPEAGLAPPPGTRERSLFYRWLAHLSSTVQPEMRTFFYAHEFPGDDAQRADIKRTAETRLRHLFDAIERELEKGPFVLGERYSAIDPYLLMLVRWTRNMSRPARLLPNIAAHAERVLARAPVKATFEREGLAPPFV
jgi:glutathione S-transferase